MLNAVMMGGFYLDSIRRMKNGGKGPDDLPLYMTDQPELLRRTLNNRLGIGAHFDNRTWRLGQPELSNAGGEQLLTLFGHEVMSSFETPYMRALAEIVTRTRGNVLNIGYGLGIVDRFIEEFRSTRTFGKHVIVELNESLAQQAQIDFPQCTVINDDWRAYLKQVEPGQFGGIVYDGYPLKPDEIHRDGIEFINTLFELGIPCPGTILTFYADTVDSLGNEFVDYLKSKGVQSIDQIQVKVERPHRSVQYWDYDHFVAPIITC
ncbi:hypothetical protein IPJ72_06050 [Candidatus Peregrinibacteria bacterium]|nr:MAG: hypothetical protein IPJ72_06050 [Candidatus Peregrinibacteria bacterium]